MTDLTNSAPHWAESSVAEITEKDGSPWPELSEPGWYNFGPDEQVIHGPFQTKIEAINDLVALVAAHPEWF